MLEIRLSSHALKKPWVFPPHLINTPMKIDELKKIPLGQFPSEKDEAERILINAGYEKINVDGSYANIFRRDNEKTVLKVYETKDYPYTLFVDVSLQHQDNPHFPKFSRKAVKINKNYSVVRTEYLEPFKENEVYSTYAIKAFLDFFKRKSWKDFIQQEKFFSEEPEEFDDIWDIKIIRKLIDNAPESFIEACFILSEATKNKNTYFDIEERNFRQRGNTVVFIDPLALL